MSGPDPDTRSYSSFVTFADPDGNGWLSPGDHHTIARPDRPCRDVVRVDERPGKRCRRAAAAHGEHEKRIGEADPNWPDWYADYMVREQAGTELPL